MLKKIKKFRIHIRPSYVLRNLKRTGTLNVNSDELEKSIQQEIEKTQSLISPSAIYETYSKMQSLEPKLAEDSGQNPPIISSLWNNMPNDAISISLIAVTIGLQIENEIQKSRTHSEWGNGTEGLRPKILDAIAKEALEQSINFVLKLIGEEAKDENCELTVTLPIEPATLKPALSFLEAEKAEIRWSVDGNLSPMYSSVSYCFWKPLQKSKSAKTR